MIKTRHFVTALIFATVSAAYAADGSGKTDQPASQGAASVQKQLDGKDGASVKSGGHADKGLKTALANIDAKHGKAEKAEHANKPEHPVKPEHPAHVDRPAVPDHPAGR